MILELSIPQIFLLYDPFKSIHTDDKSVKAKNSMNQYECKKILVIVVPHALSDPYAMVIEPTHTHVAHLAVLRPSGLLNLAGWTFFV